MTVSTQPIPAAETTSSPPARQRVYDYVRHGILHGTLPGGSFIEEGQISLAVGVSRTPVREAFQQLHAERVIDLLPRRGAMVRPVTVQDLMQVSDARLMIESHAIRTLCAARCAPPPAMVEAARTMRALPPTDLVGHTQANTRFHQALVAAAGNDVVAELYAALEFRQERVAVTATTLEPARLSLIHDEHDALIATIAAHDADAALSILARHLRPVREIVARLPGQAI
jgi:DNA-binding GntR family transcriptional regulator